MGGTFRRKGWGMGKQSTGLFVGGHILLVGAHELGHTLGIQHLGFLEEMSDSWRQRPAMFGGTDRGGPDLMTGSMGTPSQPLNFKPGTNERTQRAIQQLNRVGDMTPRK